jgi:hypothetical protein
MDDALLELERRFWTDPSVELYQDVMAPNGLLVFAPVGLLDKEQTLEAIGGSWPWSEVEIDDPRQVELAPGSAALVYRARGVREGQDAYEALVTSVYVRRNGGWKLALHHQTPLS